MFAKHQVRATILESPKFCQFDFGVLDGDVDREEVQLAQGCFLFDLLAIRLKEAKHHALARTTRPIQKRMPRVRDVIKIAENVHEQRHNVLRGDILRRLHGERILWLSANRLLRHFLLTNFLKVLPSSGEPYS